MKGWILEKYIIIKGLMLSHNTGAWGLLDSVSVTGLLWQWILVFNALEY
jgi:hypothetical protein